MPTVFWFKNVRFMIYPNDHGEPHAHAVGKVGHAKIRIRDGRIIQANGFSFRLLRLLSLEVIKRKVELQEYWEEFHGKN